ncbi:MAG: DUF6132 family protein [Tenuifilaceae bacterium]
MGTKNISKQREFTKWTRSKKFWRPALGIALGGLAGFAYFYFIGCRSGSCPITSSPVSSILVGSLLGLIIALD